MGSCKRSRTAMMLLSAVFFASPVQAGTALYQASFVIHAFGNDDFGYFARMPIGKAAEGSGTIPVAATGSGSGPAPVALPQSAFGVTTAADWPI